MLTSCPCWAAISFALPTFAQEQGAVDPKTRQEIEAVVPPGDEPSLAKDFDMVMLVLPGGIERTEEEYRLLFEQAGFELSSITPTTSLISVIEGRPI